MKGYLNFAFCILHSGFPAKMAATGIAAIFSSDHKRRFADNLAEGVHEGLGGETAAGI